MYHAELRQTNVAKVTESALQCFLEKGIDKTRISDVAERSGVSVMSVHRYFAGKDRLVLAANHLFGQQINATILSSIPKRLKEGPGLELVKGLLHLYTKVFCGTPTFVRWTEDYLRYGTQLLKADPTDREVVTSCHSLFEGLKEAIQKGMADGSIRCGLDPENTHNAIASLLLGEIQRCAGPFAKLYNANDSNEAHMALLEDMIVAYLSPAASPFAASI